MSDSDKWPGLFLTRKENKELSKASRKTIDVWKIYVNYGHGWEHECTETNIHLAMLTQDVYRKVCPQYPIKVVLGREPIRVRKVA